MRLHILPPDRLIFTLRLLTVYDFHLNASFLCFFSMPSVQHGFAHEVKIESSGPGGTIGAMLDGALKELGVFEDMTARHVLGDLFPAEGAFPFIALDI
jgi:hypothetical protein